MALVHGLGVGGAETMIAALARHLAARGDEVEIGCLGAVGVVGEELRAEGFEVVLHERRPGFDAGLPLRLARRLRRGSFDVVHAHQRTAFFYAGLAGLFDATPLVYSEHGPSFPPLARPRVRAFNRVFGRRARRITAVSQHLRQSLAAVEGFDANRIEIVPNAVDVGRFRPRSEADRSEARRRLGVPPGAPLVGTIGRLVAVKNHGVLLHVGKRLAERLPETRLAIVGDGVERPAIEALAARLGIADRLLLPGERRDIEALLPAFDVFCLASLSEGIPLTMLEAMATGVPVVSTAVGGIPEAARSGQEALLVPGTPPAGIAAATPAGEAFVAGFSAAIERVLCDGASAERLIRNARERVVALYSTGAVCRRYADVLARCASVRRGARTRREGSLA